MHESTVWLFNWSRDRIISMGQPAMLWRNSYKWHTMPAMHEQWRLMLECKDRECSDWNNWQWLGNCDAFQPEIWLFWRLCGNNYQSQRSFGEESWLLGRTNKHIIARVEWKNRLFGGQAWPYHRNDGKFRWQIKKTLHRKVTFHSEWQLCCFLIKYEKSYRLEMISNSSLRVTPRWRDLEKCKLIIKTFLPNKIYKVQNNFCYGNIHLILFEWRNKATETQPKNLQQRKLWYLIKIYDQLFSLRFFFVRPPLFFQPNSIHRIPDEYELFSSWSRTTLSRTSCFLRNSHRTGEWLCRCRRHFISLWEKVFFLFCSVEISGRENVLRLHSVAIACGQLVTRSFAMMSTVSRRPFSIHS